MYRDRGGERKPANQMIFGIRAVMEAIDNGKEIESLFIQRGLQGELISGLKKQLKDYGIVAQQVPVEKLNRITRKNHQGVIASISPITYHKIENIIPAVFESGRVPLLFILDRMTDVRNLGAIARTALCAGADALIVPQKGSAEINPDAIKTSAGALFQIPVCREANLVQCARFLQESGLQVVSCTEKTTSDIYKLDYTQPTAFVLGAEDEGISDDLIRLSDHLAKIPLIGEMDSLNVSVSAGVVAYEAVRQRLTN